MSHVATYLDGLKTPKSQLLFKYWIALECAPRTKNDGFNSTHMGLVLLVKTSGTALPRFKLDTSATRIPYRMCSACGKNVKDWGGKKHLMNPKGSALSDVWRALDKPPVAGHVIPDFAMERIKSLTKDPSAHFLHIVEETLISNSKENCSLGPSGHTAAVESTFDLKSLTVDTVYEGDCIAFLESVRKLYPGGVFDLAFADPPYNLKKSYDSYSDSLAEHNYLEWCEEWLNGMIRTLKPGGSLFLLNLPKWAFKHVHFLSRKLIFRRWIVWDALSDPRGKLMPAHYSLLYFTKPGAEGTVNYRFLDDTVTRDNECVAPPDSPDYCLRTTCVKTRKLKHDDRKVDLSDIWADIHRIKHRRDRDKHPCQLPEKLLERIITLASAKGGIVFDPFCGAGTTALVAKKLGRRFVTIDIDPKYAELARHKLSRRDSTHDTFRKTSVRRTKLPFNKNRIERFLQELARSLGKVPSEEEIHSADPELLHLIDSIYPSRLAAIKRCRIALSQ